MRLLSTLASLCVLLAFAASARAVVVTNFSFESPDLNDVNNVGAASAPGWTTTAANVGVFDSIDSFFSGTTGNNFPLPAPADGGQMLFTNNIGGVGSATQIVGTAAADTKYTLTVAVGKAKAGAVFGTYLIELLAGSTVIATAPAVTPTVDTFVDVSAISGYLSAGDPLVGQSLSILIAQNDSSSGAQRQNFYDNVRLTAVVPEPASLALLGSGILALAARRRR